MNPPQTSSDHTKPADHEEHAIHNAQNNLPLVQTSVNNSQLYGIHGNTLNTYTTSGTSSSVALQPSVSNTFTVNSNNLLISYTSPANSTNSIANIVTNSIHSTLAKSPIKTPCFSNPVPTVSSESVTPIIGQDLGHVTVPPKDNSANEPSDTIPLRPSVTTPTEHVPLKETATNPTKPNAIAPLIPISTPPVLTKYCPDVTNTLPSASHCPNILKPTDTTTPRSPIAPKDPTEVAMRQSTENVLTEPIEVIMPEVLDLSADKTTVLPAAGTQLLTTDTEEKMSTANNESIQKEAGNVTLQRQINKEPCREPSIKKVTRATTTAAVNGSATDEGGKETLEDKPETGVDKEVTAEERPITRASERVLTSCMKCDTPHSDIWHKSSQGIVLCSRCSLMETGANKSFKSKVNCKRLNNKKLNQKTVKKPKETKKKSGNPYKLEHKEATYTTATVIYYKGIRYKIGDVFSIRGKDRLYYVCVKHFMEDPHCNQYVVVIWLLPLYPHPSSYNPTDFLLGPAEDVPRPIDCLSFVSHEPPQGHVTLNELRCYDTLADIKPVTLVTDKQVAMNTNNTSGLDLLLAAMEHESVNR